MRESDQTQRMKSQGELIPERKPPLSSLTNTNSNAPLMTLTPTPASSSSNSSSAFYKDLTSTLFDQNPPPQLSSQPMYSMPTSQTMPSLMRPTIPQQQQQPRPNFSSSSNKTDLTSSLLNNMNSLGSRPQTSPTTRPMNSMTTNPSMPTPFFNSGATNNGALFQPPPPPGSTVVKGTNAAQPKTAASELDDLFN
jgi:hypothetical protein